MFHNIFIKSRLISLVLLTEIWSKFEGSTIARGSRDSGKKFYYSRSIANYEMVSIFINWEMFLILVLLRHHGWEQCIRLVLEAYAPKIDNTSTNFARVEMMNKNRQTPKVHKIDEQYIANNEGVGHIYDHLLLTCWYHCSSICFR